MAASRRPPRAATNLPDLPLHEADFYQAQLLTCSLLDCDLTGAGVRIDSGQEMPLGTAVLRAMGVQIGDRPADRANP